MYCNLYIILYALYPLHSLYTLYAHEEREHAWEGRGWGHTHVHEGDLYDSGERYPVGMEASHQKEFRKSLTEEDREYIPDGLVRVGYILP